MQPADFDYIRVGDLDHALELLAQHGPEAKVLAGGQSLLPILTLRMSRPALLVDIARLSELAGVETTPDLVRIGATVTHAEIERGPNGRAARAALPLLGQAAGLIGHHPIRTRGTMGGSIAHADPSAEWCLVATLLDAELTIDSARGRRTQSAAGFFRGFLTTDLAPDEILTSVSIPRGADLGRVLEFTRRHGDFPVVSVAVAGSMPTGGGWTDLRIAVGGVGEVPVRISNLEPELRGARLTEQTIAEIADAVADQIQPPSDIHGTSAYRRQLARVLTMRSLRDLAREAGEDQG